MALTTDSPTPGTSKKPVDSAVNMIPFIDLLVCSIAFLIITAVWTQLERLDVKQQGGVRDGDSAPPTPTIVVRMSDTGLVIVDDVGAARAVPKSTDRHDLARLGRELGQLRPAVPQGTRVLVTPDDGQRYEEIVAVMDTAVAARFDDLTMSSP